ncbi:sensor [Metapseudomonas resinovorans]|uniref:FecR domain-containing protein n=1 Tax=Metapseudomonas resinovorans TaxID=53412 RepID=UPI000984211C|nr:FecR domain-containing protein [Pseudomonas resinovorans]GLZ88712.1 sensor [Pseudomonas resinovorans]
MSNDQDALIEQASRWIVLLRSGAARDEDFLAFSAWRAQDPRHERLCTHLEQALGVFRRPVVQDAGGELLQRVLQAPSSRRQLLQRALVGSGLMVGAGLLGNRITPLDELTADLRTGTGQRRSLHAEDGSRLVINARSAVDLDFDINRRLVRFRGGELLAQVARSDRRPFVVHTGMGQVSSAGAGMMVAERDGRSRVLALGGPLELVNRSGVRLRLPAGQAVDFGPHRFGPVLQARLGETAWVDGLLEVRDSPLRDVITALRPYRAGVLRVHPSLEGMRVSGLFRLDASDQVLDALSRTLPLRIVRRTDLWISLLPV